MLYCNSRITDPLIQAPYITMVFLIKLQTPDGGQDN